MYEKQFPYFLTPAPLPFLPHLFLSSSFSSFTNRSPLMLLLTHPSHLFFLASPFSPCLPFTFLNSLFSLILFTYLFITLSSFIPFDSSIFLFFLYSPAFPFLLFICPLLPLLPLTSHLRFSYSFLSFHSLHPSFLSSCSSTSLYASFYLLSLSSPIASSLRPPSLPTLDILSLSSLSTPPPIFLPALLFLLLLLFYGHVAADNSSIVSPVLSSVSSLHPLHFTQIYLFSHPCLREL